MKYLSSEEMREIDSLVPEKYGITVSRMMENAGYEVADFVRKNLSETTPIVVFSGKGNNGGDGLVAARRLYNWGFEVIVVLASREQDGIRKKELQIAEKLGIKILDPGDELPDNYLAVDALIGYSIKGNPRPPFKQLVGMVNDAEKVVAVDIPTGIDPDTGEPYQDSVNADYVVTLGAPIKGLQKLDADIWLADISLPEEIYTDYGVEAGSLFAKSSLVKL